MHVRATTTALNAIAMEIASIVVITRRHQSVSCARLVSMEVH